MTDIVVDPKLVGAAIESLIEDDLVGFEPHLDHFLAVSIRNTNIRDKYEKLKSVFWPETVHLLRQMIVEDEFPEANYDLLDKNYQGVMKNCPGFVKTCEFIINQGLEKQKIKEKEQKKEIKKIAKEEADKLWKTSKSNPDREDKTDDGSTEGSHNDKKDS